MKTMKKRMIGFVLVLTLMVGCCVPSAFAGTMDLLPPSAGSRPGISQTQDAFFDAAMANTDSAQIDLTEPLQNLLGELGLNVTVQHASTTISYLNQQLNLVIDSSLVYQGRTISDTISLSAQKDGDWKILSCSDTRGIVTALWILLEMAQS